MILLHCFGIGINERMETSRSARNDDSSLARPSCYYITVVNEAVGNDYLKFFKIINQHKATYSNTAKRTSDLGFWLMLWLYHPLCTPSPFCIEKCGCGDMQELFQNVPFQSQLLHNELSLVNCWNNLSYS